MKQKIFLILLLQISVISCGTKKGKNSETPLTEVNEINVQIKEEQLIDKMQPVEARIDNIIPLETNSKSVIGNCYKLAFTSDKVIILDAMDIRDSSNKPKVLMFDTLGNFIQVVGSRGKGPEEYFAPMNLQIGPNDEIQVYCNVKSSILSYDVNGRFLSTIKLPHRTPYFATLGEGDFIIEYPTKKSEFHIGIYNQEKDTTLYYLPISDRVKSTMFLTSLNAEFGFSKFKGHYFFCPQKSKKIYELIDGKPVVKYNLDIAGLDYYLPEPPKDFSSMEGISKIRTMQKLMRHKSKGKDQLEKITYLQSNVYDKINFSFNWAGIQYTILRDKKSGRIMVGTTQSKTRDNLVEISNLLLFYANTITYEGKFVAAINTEELKNLSKIYHELPKDKLNQLCYNPKKLKEIVESKEAYSNQVLVIFSLKEANE